MTDYRDMGVLGLPLPWEKVGRGGGHRYHPSLFKEQVYMLFEIYIYIYICYLRFAYFRFMLFEICMYYGKCSKQHCVI